MTKNSNADLLAQIGCERAELWHTPGGNAYATVEVNGHAESHRVMSTGFRRYLAFEFWRERQKAPAPNALQQALTLLDARAIYDGLEHDVFLRVAPRPGGGLVLDLGDADWRCIEVDELGWRVVERPQVRFRRATGMLPLPEPVCGGSLEEVAAQLSVGRDRRDGDDEQIALLLGYLVSTFRPRGPYWVLNLQGEHGSLKSTKARKLRRLVDPSASDLRGPPRQARDLAIAAENAWVVAYDNLSGVPDWLSDALCRIATGGGFATRGLYSDDSERIFDATRPIILTGIGGVITRSDLIDRAIDVTLPQVKHYRPEAEVWADFDTARPRMLGALLDAVSHAIANEGNTILPPGMRMADATRWAVAAEPRLPVAPGTFLAAYAGVRQEGHRAALEGSVIGAALLGLLDAGAEWSGTSSELLDALAAQAGERAVRSKDWPRTARALSAEVARLAPALRALGGEADRPRRRLWSLKGPQSGADDRQDRRDRHADDGEQPPRDGDDGHDGRMHASEGVVPPREDAPAADDAASPGVEPW